MFTLIKTRRAAWMAIGLGLVCLIFLVVSLIFFEPPVYLFVVPSEQWGDYRKSRIIRLPNEVELLNPTPYSDELLLAARNTAKIYRKHAALQPSFLLLDTFDDAPTSQSQTLLPGSIMDPAITAASDEFLHAYRDLVARPGFDQDVLICRLLWSDDVPSLGLGVGELRDFHYLAAYSATGEALRHLEMGDIPGAAVSLQILRDSIRFDTLPDELRFMLQSQSTGIYLFHLATILKACPHPDLARAILDQWQDFIFNPSLTQEIGHPAHLDLVGMTRYFAKRGLKVRSMDGAERADIWMPEGEYAQPYLRLEIERMRPYDPVAVQELEAAMAFQLRAGNISAPWKEYWPFEKAAKSVTMPLLYSISVVNTRGADIRSKTRIQADLLKVCAAQILFTDDHSTTPTAWSDLIPAYLPDRVQDPFAKSPSHLLLDGEPRSVGEDQDDDKGREVDVAAPVPDGKPDGDLTLRYSESCAELWKKHLPPTN